MESKSSTTTEKRRREIAMAFYNCAREKGISATTTRDIAREAGVKQGLLYHYFKDREDMIEEMVVSIANDHVDNFVKNLEMSGSPVDALDAATDFLISEEMIRDNGSLFYDIWSEAKRNERVARAMERTYNIFRKTIFRFLHDSAIADGMTYADINNLASIIMAIFEGVFLQWDFDRTNVDLPALKDISKTMVRSYVESKSNARISVQDDKKKKA